MSHIKKINEMDNNQLVDFLMDFYDEHMYDLDYNFITKIIEELEDNPILLIKRIIDKSQNTYSSKENRRFFRDAWGELIMIKGFDEAEKLENEIDELSQKLREKMDELSKIYFPNKEE